jgi:hypothetical protein
MTSWHKHHWKTRTVLDRELNQIVPCQCPWYYRLWFLATGR